MELELLGIACGPFNLSLATLLKETNVNHLFIDKKKTFSWHSGMQLEYATIQNSSTKDLVTLTNPTSEFSFLNFLYENGRLESHIISNFSHILRWEYEQYMKWVVSKLDTIKFDCDVKLIEPTKNGFEITVENESKTKILYAKNISLATGVIPFIPDCIKDNMSDRIFHNSEYKYHSKDNVNSVVIIGGGQSALEVLLDILNNHKNIKDITMIYKEPFISQIEGSQFEEDKLYTENGLNEFYQLEYDLKNKYNIDFRLTSDGASKETIQEVYQKLYFNEYYDNKNKVNFKMYEESSLNELSIKNEKIKLEIKNLPSNNKILLDTDMVILATGYRQYFPKELFSKEILSNLILENDSSLSINEDYSLRYNGQGKIYFLNGCKHTHGVTDPNLSLNAVRARKIFESLTKKSATVVKQKNFLWEGLV